MPVFEFSPTCQIYYLDENTSSPDSVILLHGLGAHSGSWVLQTPALHQAGFRTIAPDSPGFGHSTYPGGRTSINRFTTPIIALLDRVEIPRLTIVGISMGGTMALQIALDHPERVSRLVLVNTFAHLNITSPRLLPYLIMRFVLVHTLGLPSQAKAVAKRLFPYPDQEVLRQALIEQVNMAEPRAYRAAMRALARFDVRKRLREIQCNALVITGERDTTVPLETQSQMAQGISGARQVVIPAAGHGVTVEKPDAFNQILVEFLCS
jgi:pimeloyl-ACP methyl ester carboxylesterase